MEQSTSETICENVALCYWIRSFSIKALLW